MITVFLPSLEGIGNILIQTDVIDMGKGGHHLFENLNLLLGKELGYLTAWILQIPKSHRPGGAGLHAGGQKACVHSMNTEITLLNHTGDRIHKPDIIRAGGPTVITTDTSVGINHYNSILPGIGRLHRTYRIANRTSTLIAEPGQEKGLHSWVPGLFGPFAVRAIPGQGERSHLRVGPFLHDPYPDPPDTERDLMFGLTGHLAGMASHATPEVNDHSPSHFFFHKDAPEMMLFLFRLCRNLIFSAKLFIGEDAPDDI